MSSRTESSVSSARSLLLVAVGLAIAYLPSYIIKIFNILNVQIGPDGPPAALIWNWLAVILLLAYILVIERRRLASILLTKPSEKDFEWALWFLGISTTTSWLIYTLFPQGENQGMSELLSYPIPLILGIIITAAITEEILFRGYVIERLREITGQAWLAIATSFIIFVLPHLTYFGIEWLWYHGIGTIMIYVLYVWRKNLYACMFLHLLGNLPILIPALGLFG